MCTSKNGINISINGKVLNPPKLAAAVQQATLILATDRSDIPENTINETLSSLFDIQEFLLSIKPDRIVCICK